MKIGYSFSSVDRSHDGRDFTLCSKNVKQVIYLSCLRDQLGLS